MGAPDDDDLDVGGLPSGTPSPGVPAFTGGLEFILPYGVESTASGVKGGSFRNRPPQVRVQQQVFLR